jgi:transcriptional regulator with XRE-family HTH domain
MKAVGKTVYKRQLLGN